MENANVLVYKENENIEDFLLMSLQDWLFGRQVNFRGVVVILNAKDHGVFWN